MLDLKLPTQCYSCGSADIVSQTPDYAVCAACDERYYSAMAQTYPFGQCQTCGAEGFSWTCARGVQHTVWGWEAGGHHSEGGCGAWRDSGALDGYPDVPCITCYDAEQARRPLAPMAEFSMEDLPF